MRACIQIRFSTITTLALCFAGCSSQVHTVYVDARPLAQDCDWILVTGFDEWNLAIESDDSYQLTWGQSGVTVLVPASHSPLRFKTVHHQLELIPLDASLDVDAVPLIAMASEHEGTVLIHAGMTDRNDLLRPIFETAIHGARPFWQHERPTLDDLRHGALLHYSDDLFPLPPN